MTLISRSLLLVLLLAVYASGAGAQVSANFTTDYTSGCAPLVVHFTNTTAACASCTYSWNFGNGDPAVPGPGPVSTSYTSAGTYTATLTVDDGGVITTHSVTITVIPSPTVSFTAHPLAVCPGGTVYFTSTTVAGVPGAVTCAWAFGDGGSGTGATPSHVYDGPAGMYTVTLFATNSSGCQSSLAETDYIDVYAAPVAGFDAIPNYFCSAPADVSFTNTTTGTAPLSYVWTFGDGSAPLAATAPTHDYTSLGYYTVTLVVTDGHGCEDSLTDFDYVVLTDVAAGISAPGSACVNTTVTFDNTSAPSSIITSHVWNYGDGSPADTAETGSHLYGAAGTYTVTLVVSTGGCNDTARHTIIIEPGPVASFTINPTQPCLLPAAVTLTASAPAGTTIDWIDGDGSTGAGSPYTHTYASPAIATISMIATNAATGCKDTVTKTDTLYNLMPEAGAMPDAGCAPLTVHFSGNVLSTAPSPPVTAASVPYPYGVASYSWDFGDGSAPVADSAANHTYTAAGVYTAVLTMRTDNGCTVTDTVKVWVGAPPVVTIVGMPDTECYHDNSEVFTADIISGPATWFEWSFSSSGFMASASDSGTTPTTDVVTASMPGPGVYTVTVVGFYNGCPSAPATRTDFVTIDSPMAIAGITIACSPPGQVKFGDSSLGDNTHIWFFGDGDTSTLADPVHVYSVLTTYTAMLATYNTASGCRDTEAIPLSLARPVAAFTANDTAICKDGYITFTPALTGDSATHYAWYRDSVARDDTSEIYTDTFHTTGFYSIMLVITDQNGCNDTVNKPNYVEVAGPVPAFTAVPSSGCRPLTVTYTDHSADITGVPLVSYAWSFGDGAASTVMSTPVTHTFTAVGADTTREIITDRLGCKDSATVVITVTHPVASIVASETYACAYFPVAFTDTAGGAVSGYLWSFGDGSTSTAAAPEHSYTASGTYTVQLIVSSASGCTDTATRTSLITVGRPAASFRMSDSTAICPPLPVSFTNTSTGAVAYYWRFGDGTSSVLASPADLYITPGLYDIMLIAYNSAGCADTAFDTAVIYGYAGSFTYTPDSGCVPLTVHFAAAISNVPNIVWDFGNGHTDSATLTDTITYTYTLPGAYVPKLILSHNTGCQNSVTGPNAIRIDSAVAGFTENPNPECIGGTFNFVDTSASYFSTITSITWQFLGDTDTASAPAFTIDTPGAYPATLTVTDGWGCTGSVTQNVLVYPPPVITTSPDTIICTGDAATLTAYGGVKYVWSPPAALGCATCNPTTASPAVVTTYTVTGTDAHGCVSTDTTTVYQKNKTVSVAASDTSVCLGQEVQLSDSGATKFDWIPQTGLNNAHISDPDASPLATITYTVVAQLGSCAPDSNTVTVKVYPGPVVNASGSQTILTGEQAQLFATGSNIATYQWSPGGPLACTTCPDPIATPSVTTEFVVQVASEQGCTATDSVIIYVQCGQGQIFVPNAFTPNNDGKDDIFYPRGVGISIVRSFRIYNRWGELLFERDGIQLNDESNGWDGTYNGNMPRPDVYVYIIDAICETGQPVDVKGNVTIIR